MNSSSIVSVLEEYADLAVGTSEQTLARVAARWIAVDPTAISDPLLKDLLSRAQLTTLRSATAATVATVATTATPHTPFVSSRQPKSILSYFTPIAPTTPTDTKRSEEEKRGEEDVGNSGRHVIYCDGACQANGRRGARAGWGALLQSPQGAELESVSSPLASTEPQTNQRAELRALQWAFTKAMSLPKGADIHTDSEYAIKCFTEWGALWAAKGWRKAAGGEVLHQDLLRPMWELWRSRGTHIRLYHVSAHTGRTDRHSRGNARADTLAVASLSKQ